MNDPTNFRMERIEKLLYELRYEIERGMINREIDETINFNFIVPVSKSIPDGVVKCQFSTRPIPRYQVPWSEGMEPKLRLVKSQDK
jgi:hypothetical protein